MNMLRTDMPRWTSFLSVVTLLCTGSALSAAPILITQTFGPAAGQVNVNGTLQTVTGDWIFKVQTDTTNPDLEAISSLGRFATSSITVSNTGLGLTDVAVTSHLFYYEVLGNRSGIANSALVNGTILTGPSGSVGDPNIIESAALDFTASVESSFFFGPGTPLVLADGTQIRSGFNTASGVQSSGPVSTSVVPEPSTFALASIGLMALGLCGWRRRRKTAV